MASNGTFGWPELATKPSAPTVGVLMYVKTDGNIYLQNTSGVETAFGSTNALTGLTGDVTATGPGNAAAAVAFVGGQTAANIAAATVAVESATSAATAGALVLRDGTGAASFSQVTATTFNGSLNGNAATATSAATAIDFTGSMSGDVTGTQSATVVGYVGGKTSSDIANAVTEVDAATPNNVANTLVYRDVTGSIQVTTVTGNVVGNVAGNVSGSAATFTSPLSGDVTGNQTSTVVGKIQGVIVNATTPTDAQFLVYNSSTTQWAPVSMSGDVSIARSGAASIASATVTGKLLTGYVVGSNTPILATDSILAAFEKVQGQLNATSSAAITALTGDGTATGPGSVAFTLATVNSNAGSFGNQTAVATFTVNDKGLITAASNVTIGNLTNSNLSGSAGITGANIASSTVSNTNLAQMAANTVKANTGAIPANPVDTALGTVSEATSSVLVLTGWTDATIGAPTIQVLQSSTSQSGYLSSTDWNTFNNKQTAGAYITELTGDGTATGPGSAALTLATVNSDVGSFGSSTAIPTVTVNGKGLITAITTNAVVAPAGTLTGTTLASNVVSSSLTSVGTVTSGVWNATPVAIAYGGTNNSTAYAAGSIIFSNGTSLTQDNANFYWNNSSFSLGIGTQPEANTTIDIVNSSGSAAALQQTSYSGGVGFRGRYANGTLLSPTAAMSGNILNYLSARGYGATGFISTATGSINIIAGETFSDTSAATYLTFTSTPTGSTSLIERMRINSTGNVLIGTTTDAGQLLQVNGTANVSGAFGAASATFSGPVAITASSTAAFQIGGATGLTVDSVNGAVGIGIQPESGTIVDIVNNSGTTKVIQQTGYGSNIGVRGRMANGTSTAPTAALSGNILNFFSGRGYGASQFATTSTGALNIVAGENFTNTSNETYLQFVVTPTGSVTASEHMRVAATGVTLGAQSSSTDLHIVNGGWIRTTKTITASYAVDSGTTDDIILCNQSGAITITLPTPTVGRTVVIKDSSGNAQNNPITVAPHASEMIEGLSASKTLYTNYGSWTFHVGSAGNWWQI